MKIAGALAPLLLFACTEYDSSAPDAAMAENSSSDLSTPAYMRTAHGVLRVQPVLTSDGYVLVMGDIKFRRDDFERYRIAPEDLEAELAREPDDRLRGAIRAAGAARWPDGVIPFVIDAALTDVEERWVRGAIAHWQEVTPFRFVARNGQDDFVRFVRGDSCSSHGVGRQGNGEQMIEVSGCDPEPQNNEWGRVAHEIGHAVGMFHEMSRTDRDTYVTINEANIRPATATENCPHQFETFISQGRDGQNVGPYDYDSIMHYSATQCAIAGTQAMTPKQSGVTIGQRNALSLGDRYTAWALFHGTKLVSSGPQVTLYRDANYQGVRQSFLPGFYNAGATNNFLDEIGQDQATSLRVPVGLAARLCIDNGEPDLGSCYTYTTDTAQLPSSIDNRASTVIVERAVTVYRESNLTGVRQTLRRGNHYANQGGLSIVGNDHISSLHVPPGLVAELCWSESGTGSTGQYCQTFEGSVNFVGDFMNDQTSLVRVKSAATLWQESRNWGNRKSLTVGTHTSWTPVAGISSVSVGEGLQAVMCDQSNGGGPCATFKGDVQFVGPDLNDKISYVRVEAAQ